MRSPAAQRFLSAAEVAASFLDEETLDRYARQFFIDAGKSTTKSDMDPENGRADRDDLGAGS